jgi:hypothetical protein
VIVSFIAKMVCAFAYINEQVNYFSGHRF